MLASLGQGGGDNTQLETPKKVREFFLVRPYSRFLAYALRQRLVFLGVALVLFAAALSLLAGLGSELIPEISQGEFFIDLQLPPGTPVEQTSRRIEEVEAVIRQEPDVERYYTIVGSGNQTGASAVEEREHIGQILVTQIGRASCRERG